MHVIQRANRPLHTYTSYIPLPTTAYGEAHPTARYVGKIVIIAYIVMIPTTLLMRIYYRWSQSHGKPLLACALDTLCEIPALLELGPWKHSNGIQRALETAMAETGLHDFGTEDGAACKPSGSVLNKVDRTGFIQRYLVTREAGRRASGVDYSPLGHLIVGNVLHKRMCTRLRHIDYFKKHTQIRQVPIKNPIFVIGFPRTGTTFLHEMLGLHPNVKMHYTWEQMDHVPKSDVELPTAQRADRQQRYDKNRGHFRNLMHVIGTNIQKIHRIGYDDPEECTTPCAMELPWAVPELPLMVFALPELLQLGCGLAFDYYKEYLQLMTWQSAGGIGIGSPGTPIDQEYDLKTTAGARKLGSDSTWMLKCPFHLPYLEELFQTFPDATVVWTHRDPVECIASACSLYETLAEMGCESWSIDKKAMGKAVLKYTQLCLERAEQTISKINQKYIVTHHGKGQNPVIHVRYQETVKNPQEICTGILKQAGVLDGSATDQTYHSNVEAYVADSTAKRAAEKTLNKISSGSGADADSSGSVKKVPVLHAYNLEEYGLSEEMVRETFKEYTDKYNLVAKK